MSRAFDRSAIVANQLAIRFESDLRARLQSLQGRRKHVLAQASRAMEPIARHLDDLDAAIKRVMPEARLMWRSEPELIADDRVRCTYELSGVNEKVPLHFDITDAATNISFVRGDNEKPQHVYDLAEDMREFYPALQEEIMQYLLQFPKRS